MGPLAAPAFANCDEQECEVYINNAYRSVDTGEKTYGPGTEGVRRNQLNDDSGPGCENIFYWDGQWQTTTAGTTCVGAYHSALTYNATIDLSDNQAQVWVTSYGHDIWGWVSDFY
jgi:hypothetical protein